jgi:hypothetical protein
VVVPVALVSYMAMAVMKVVDMPLVWHGHVPAAGAVLVCMPLMDRMLGRLALVHVVLVHSVDVAVVDVVGVIAVGEGDVAASVAVDVRVVGMDAVFGCRRHVKSPHWE